MQTAGRMPVRTSATVGMILLLVLAACGGSGDAGVSGSGPEAEVASDAGSAAEVEIRLIKFRPETITVPAETQITWTQDDAGFHTVTSGTVARIAGGVTTEPDGEFSSGEIPTGSTYQFTFDEPGTYPYFCEVHPATMTGEVTVEA